MGKREKMSYHYKDFNMMYDKNLFTAAKMGDAQMVKSLLESGFPVNHRDKYNKTALHHAVEGLNYECVRILLAHGSTQNVRDNLYRAPVDILNDLSARAPAKRQQQIDDIR